MLHVIGIADDRRHRLDLVLDAVEAGADRDRHGEVRVHVGGGDAVFDALRFLRARDDAQRAGAVLDAPGRVGRRPEAGDQARIGVDRAAHHAEQLRHQRLLAADEPALLVAHVVRLLGVVEHRLAVLALEADVDVAALAGPVVGPLGHEGRHQAAALRQHFHEGLEQGGAVGALERLVEGEGGLENARAGLGVQALDRHAHLFAGVEDLVIELGPDRAAYHRIAEIAGRHRRQVAEALFADALRRLVEHEEFVLGRGIGLDSPSSRPYRAHGAGRRGDRSPLPCSRTRTRKNSVLSSNGISRQVSGITRTQASG